MKGAFSNDIYTGIYYDPKDPRNISYRQNRQLFLQCAADNVPLFGESLFDATFPLLRGWLGDIGQLPIFDRDFEQRMNKITDTIRTWAKGFNIEQEWVILEGHDILDNAWESAKMGGDPMDVFRASWGTLHIGNEQRDFRLPAWNPLAESPQKYAVRVDEAWRRSRDEYVAATKTQLRKDGLRPVPKRRTRRTEQELRFEWTVLRRCTGVSFEKLAKDYNEGVEVIRISVTRVLKDLGFQPPT